ncbi:tetratricopeptide repeat protein [Planctomycetes bacterium K23_9]|uniref:Anaphase-promoting complex, cyclosome, subunit 3 n=1 Tax=Stieleria marina TaxID=1930275 RepID=A0A517NXM9_9BACT|nr:Anaphase-promoting complex, cyclosome, subunit 3 [Planctomycetes bacterium K23_9]
MFRTPAFWTVALLATGAVGGLIYNWPRIVPSDATSQSASETDESTNEGSPSEDSSRGFTLTQVSTKDKAELSPLELDPLFQGDRLLLGGNAIGAYQQYNRLPENIAKSMDASILVRQGLAAEQAGFLDRSEQHFRDAIGASARESIQQVWAMIGMARVWEMQDRIDESISLLSELYLMYSTDRYPQEVRLPISRQLADCLQRRSLKESGETLITNEDDLNVDLKKQLEYYWAPMRLEPVLEETDWVNKPTSARAEDILTIIQRPIDDVSLILVNADSSMYPLSQLVMDLQRATRMQFDLSAQARSTLSGRSVRVDVEALPVSLLLDQAFSAHDLAWQQNNGRVRIVHLDEWKPEQRAKFVIGRTQRLQRQIQLQFPNGIERVVALLHDANNSFMMDEVGAAADKYRSVRELDPTGELNAAAYFNSAVFALAQKEKETALNEFYLALDQTLSPRLQGKAYARIGEIEILSGRPEHAVAAASRGLRLAAEDVDANRSLMALAKAYLLMSDAYSANQALFNHASSLTDERSKRLATVLSTHARFEVIKPTDGLQNEGERLVLSLASLRADDPRDFVEHLMVSRAFAAVGFRSKAINHLSIATDQVQPGYWQSRIPLELAEILFQSGDLDRAVETLKTMVASDDVTMQTRAKFLKAEIHLKLNQLDQVESLCNELLRMTLSEIDQRRALQMLGKAFQKSGQHYSAALCFAGLLPDGSNSLRSPSSSPAMESE